MLTLLFLSLITAVIYLFSVFELGVAKQKTQTKQIEKKCMFCEGNGVKDE